MKPIIEILDPVHCRAEKPLRLEIYNSLKYKEVGFRAAAFGTKSKIQTRSFIDKRSGLFLTGLLPRVSKYLSNKKIKHKVVGEPFEKLNTKKIDLPLTLRGYQSQAIKAIVSKQRGVILSPTGSGKTVIVMAACSTYRDYRILFLCHTKDLLAQTVEEFKTNLAHLRLQVITGGMSKKIDVEADVVLATIQSFAKINALDYMDHFGVVIVDEAHHCNSRKCQLGLVVQKTISPVKIGFTATLPESRKGILALEGIIGPVLYEYTTDEGMKEGFLATPKITLVPVPPVKAVTLNRRWKDIYKDGVVNNRIRNGKIVQMVFERVSRKKSVLIMVREIEHGDILKDLLEKAELKVAFVQGATDAVLRKRVKKAFIDKTIKVVISTAIWREGINLPTLDVVLNACGGKSELSTLQAIGRGLRISEGKEKVEIIDFLDPYKYLSEHSVQRLHTYYKNNWL